MAAPASSGSAGVGKSFGAHRVLQASTSTSGAARWSTIIGPSGSGKTTLLRCINLLEIYDDGSIQIDGVEVGYRDGDGRRAGGRAASASSRRSAPRSAWSSSCSTCSRT